MQAVDLGDFTGYDVREKKRQKTISHRNKRAGRSAVQSRKTLAMMESGGAAVGSQP